MLKRVLLIAIALCIPGAALAWVPSGDVVKITNIIRWEGQLGTVLQLSNGMNCYIPAVEVGNFSLALAIFMAGKSISIHCHDTEDDVGGYPAHRLHRIIAQ